MKLGQGLPVWLLRGSVLVAVALILVMLAAQGVATIPLFVVGLFGVLTVLAPASPAAAMLIVATAVCATTAGTSPFQITVLALLPLVHFVHLGSAVTAIVPGTARIHLTALRPAAIRFVLVQAGVFALAGLAALVPEAVTPTELEIAGLTGAAVLAALAARLITKRSR